MTLFPLSPLFYPRDTRKLSARKTRGREACALFGFASALLASFLLLCGARTLAAEPSLKISADPNRIYLSESFALNIRMEGVDEEPGPAVFETSAPADYSFAGSSSDSRTFVSIINGRTMRQESRARILSYRFTPEEPGIFQIHKISVPWSGGTLTARGPAVQVIGQTEQDILEVLLEASRTSVLVGEPFEISVSIIVKSLPAPHSTGHPFLSSETPGLEIPFLAHEAPNGLSRAPTEEILQPLLDNRRGGHGFRINGLTVRNDPFFGGFQSTAARFRLPREEIRWRNQPAMRYTLKISHIPGREGSYHFDPVTFKGSVITAVDSTGKAASSRIFTTSKDLVVTVEPPPEEGRPASFLGSLGTGLSAVAALDTQTCRQGDPITLTVDITGNLSLDNLRPPPLSENRELSSLFRVYDSAVREEKIPEGRRFRYTIRPLQAGTIELPPLPYSYYDTEQRRYVTVSTAPIPLRVDAVEQFDPDRIIDTGGESSGESFGTIRLLASRSLPAAITVHPSGVRPDPALLSPRHALLLLPGPLAVSLAALVRSAYRQRERRRRRRRKRNALRRAVRRIARAATHKELLGAVSGFFAERFELAEAGFSPSDADLFMRDTEVHAELRQEITSYTQRVYDESFLERPPDTQLFENAKSALPGLLRKLQETTLEAKP